MDRPEEEQPTRRDWKISVTLLAVWLIALILVTNSESEIPISMLAIATVFFVLLIPAMNDLVRSVERYFEDNFGSHDGNHDGADNPRR